MGKFELRLLWNVFTVNIQQVFIVEMRKQKKVNVTRCNPPPFTFEHVGHTDKKLPYAGAIVPGHTFKRSSGEVNRVALLF